MGSHSKSRTIMLYAAAYLLHFIQPSYAASESGSLSNSTFANLFPNANLSSAILQPFFQLAVTPTNGSKIIVAGGSSGGVVAGGIAGGVIGGVAGSGGITLNQCNSQCLSVNTVLFQTCGAHQDVFSDQMHCACSTTFTASVTECSSCCSGLGFTAQVSELVQIMSACQTLVETGNSTTVSISFSTVTNTATATATVSLINYETVTEPPITVTSVVPIVSTVYYTISESVTTFSVVTTTATSVYTSTIPPTTITATTTTTSHSTTTTASSSTTTTSSSTTTTTKLPAVTSTALPTVSVTSNSTNDRQDMTHVLVLLALFVFGSVFV